MSFHPIHGELMNSDYATPQTVVAATPEILEWETLSHAVGITGSQGDGEFTLLSNGYYKINFSASVSSGTANIEVDFHFYVDDVETGAGCHRSILTANDDGDMGFNVHHNGSVGDVLAIWVESDTNADLTITDSTFITHRIE